MNWRAMRRGRGGVYLGLHDDVAKVMDDFFARISHPAMTDVKVDWGGMQVGGSAAFIAAGFVRGPAGDGDGTLCGEWGRRRCSITGKRGWAAGIDDGVAGEAGHGGTRGQGIAGNLGEGEELPGLAERMSYESNAELAGSHPAGGAGLQFDVAIYSVHRGGCGPKRWKGARALSRESAWSRRRKG